MKLVGLISGGKDSIYSILQCISAGHEIVAVANIEPDKKDELNSYMYQSVGHEAVSLIATALELPIFRQKTKGKAVCKQKVYTETTHDEVEDLLHLLIKVQKSVEITGVSVGAISSDYQRTRVENVCRRLNLICFAYLWRRDQAELLEEMIESGVDALIIKVASIGLMPETHLGMHIKDIRPHLIELNKKFGVNVCGEGGEYETLTIDCPLFHRKISIVESEHVIFSNDAFAPVAFLNVKNAALKSKAWDNDDPVQSLETRLTNIKNVVKNPYHYVEDCVDEVTANIFPQRRIVTSTEDLPFPFGSDDELTEDEGGEGPSFLLEYWKKDSSSKMYSGHKLTNPSIVPGSDTTNCSWNFTSGWCCFGNITSQSVPGAFALLLKHLERLRYGMKDVVFVVLIVRDMTAFSSLNKMYAEFMPKILPPARVCIETHLPPEVNVLMHVVAHKVVSKFQKAFQANQFSEKEVMHVQSISHWAPANIGPYSQCVKIGGLYYVAGQIPLIPGTMEILNKPIFHQCKLSLRHVLRIMKAMKESLEYSSIVQAICYVTSQEIADDISSLWTHITKVNDSPVTTFVVCRLPKEAQLEWEVLACDYSSIEVTEETTLIDDFSLHLKKHASKDPFFSNVICKIRNAKKSGKNHKNIKIVTQDGINSALRHCIQFLKTNVKDVNAPLCILKIFFRAKDSVINIYVNEAIKAYFESKVVATVIPVEACQESDVFVTILGTCY